MISTLLIPSIGAKRYGKEKNKTRARILADVQASKMREKWCICILRDFLLPIFYRLESPRICGGKPIVGADVIRRWLTIDVVKEGDESMTTKMGQDGAGALHQKICQKLRKCFHSGLGPKEQDALKTFNQQFNEAFDSSAPSSSSVPPS